MKDGMVFRQVYFIMIIILKQILILILYLEIRTADYYHIFPMNRYSLIVREDDKIQAYCFRLCMSNHLANMVPFEKPDGYNSANYELLARVFDSGWNEWFAKYDMIPNRKTDTNNHGPFSTDYIGMNYDYPEASYERRKEIIEEHKTIKKDYFTLYLLINVFPKRLERK